MNELFKVPQHAVSTQPDTDRYKHRFDIRSESSNRIYRIAYDKAPNTGYWTCSCPGNISHGDCKHLRSMGLIGRKVSKMRGIRAPEKSVLKEL